MKKPHKMKIKFYHQPTVERVALHILNNWENHQATGLHCCQYCNGRGFNKDWDRKARHYSGFNHSKDCLVWDAKELMIKTSFRPE